MVMDNLQKTVPTSATTAARHRTRLLNLVRIDKQVKQHATCELNTLIHNECRTDWNFKI